MCISLVDSAANDSLKTLKILFQKLKILLCAQDKFDHEFCGNENPPVVISDGPRLVMVFSSGELQGRGFKVCHYLDYNSHVITDISF